MKTDITPTLTVGRTVVKLKPGNFRIEHMRIYLDDFGTHIRDIGLPLAAVDDIVDVLRAIYEARGVMPGSPIEWVRR